MKNIYLLEKLHHILNALPEEDQKQAEYFLKDMSHYYDSLNTPAAIVTDLIKEVTEDIRREEAKSGGKLAEQKAAEKILDQVPEGKASGGYMSGDRQIVGGAYSVVRLVRPLPVQRRKQQRHKKQSTLFRKLCRKLPRGTKLSTFWTIYFPTTKTIPKHSIINCWISKKF